MEDDAPPLTSYTRFVNETPPSDFRVMEGFAYACHLLRLEPDPQPTQDAVLAAYEALAPTYADYEVEREHLQQCRDYLLSGQYRLNYGPMPWRPHRLHQSLLESALQASKEEYLLKRHWDIRVLFNEAQNKHKYYMYVHQHAEPWFIEMVHYVRAMWLWNYVRAIPALGTYRPVPFQLDTSSKSDLQALLYHTACVAMLKRAKRAQSTYPLDKPQAILSAANYFEFETLHMLSAAWRAVQGGDPEVLQLLEDLMAFQLKWLKDKGADINVANTHHLPDSLLREYGAALLERVRYLGSRGAPHYTWLAAQLEERMAKLSGGAPRAKKRAPRGTRTGSSR